MRILELFESFKPWENKIIRPYVIAEAGVNHEGDMNIAKRLIYEAAEGGANAIKFQSYKAETIATRNSPAYWDLSKEPTKSQFELFKKHDLFWKKEFEELKSYCDEMKIEFISTPFDLESATFLRDLVPVYKVSSSDITNKPFIEYICQFGKPILLSTGASHLFEIQEAFDWIEKNGNPLALLHCVLNYPTPDQNANLGMISGLKRAFPETIIGYSDHTLPKDMRVLETAFLLGAIVLEKHFTHDKELPGNDHYHAMDKNDLKLFIKHVSRLLEILGETKVKALPDEETARKNARRSLVAKRNIIKGKIIQKDDLTWKRPAYGISPKEIDNVIGRTAMQNIEEDTILFWRMLS